MQSMHFWTARPLLSKVWNLLFCSEVRPRPADRPVPLRRGMFSKISWLFIFTVMFHIVCFWSTLSITEFSVQCQCWDWNPPLSFGGNTRARALAAHFRPCGSKCGRAFWQLASDIQAPPGSWQQLTSCPNWTSCDKLRQEFRIKNDCEWDKALLKAEKHDVVSLVN